MAWREAARRDKTQRGAHARARSIHGNPDHPHTALAPHRIASP